MDQQQQIVRRIVTGHNTEGKAIILSDAPAGRTYMIGGPNGAKFHEVWTTGQSPALIRRGPWPRSGTDTARTSSSVSLFIVVATRIRR